MISFPDGSSTPLSPSTVQTVTMTIRDGQTPILCILSPCFGDESQNILILTSNPALPPLADSQRSWSARKSGYFGFVLAADNLGCIRCFWRSQAMRYMRGHRNHVCLFPNFLFNMERKSSQVSDKVCGLDGLQRWPDCLLSDISISCSC